MLFIDFERAFDTIKLWIVLKNVIRELYQDADCSVLFTGTKSNKFQVDRGVRQGCVLWPLLFVVVLDSVLKKTNTDTGLRG